MTYVYDSDAPPGGSPGEVRELLGGKGANLALMTAELGLPVPPAFTITTAACRTYLAGGWPAGLDGEIADHLATLERRVGRRFGDPADPLLVSVRSGAPVSMPGMMDTILNLGLNDATTQGLAVVTGDPAFADDCRRRFEATFREVVGVASVPADPMDQLRAAIEAVFRSWNGDRARAYRRREGIPDDLSTAVTVQAMVFGNRSAESGTGVLFTRDPATGEAVLYGDVLFDAQGEDVVGGTHRTASIGELGARLPAVADALDRHARTLERHFTDVCDIEFTIEDGTLWLLQCRIGKRSPQAALRIAVEMAEDPRFPLTRVDAVRRVASLLADPPTVSAGRGTVAVVLATGLAASPGVAVGEIATTPEAAVAIAEAGRPVILVRSETSPDDVHGMARAAGLLTSSGGLASHAAVVARGWGIPAIVGATGVQVGAAKVTIGERVLPAGTTITIDGGTGEILEGAVAGETVIAPEVETLLAWAREAGVEMVAATTDSGPSATPGAGLRATRAETAASGPGPDDVVRALTIKGHATPNGLAEAMFVAPDAIAEVIAGLQERGLMEPSAGAFRLTADGRAAGAAAIEHDREQWGSQEADTALASFLELDGRMKSTVTAWQMREVDGAATFNDHSDAAYDAGVLAELAALHADAISWIGPYCATVERLAGYRVRLDRAAAAAAAGDHRFVASPRVDSYHSVWFELHEELILLAGRTRADEVAAGRA